MAQNNLQQTRDLDHAELWLQLLVPCEASRQQGARSQPTPSGKPATSQGAAQTTGEQEGLQHSCGTRTFHTHTHTHTHTPARMPTGCGAAPGRPRGLTLMVGVVGPVNQTRTPSQACGQHSIPLWHFPAWPALRPVPKRRALLGARPHCWSQPAHGPGPRPPQSGCCWRLSRWGRRKEGHPGPEGPSPPPPQDTGV